MAINAQALQGQWNQVKGQVRERWGQLTDDDLQISGGNVDQLVGRIQQRTGETREAVERFLTDLTARGSSAVAQATEAVSQICAAGGGPAARSYGDLSDQARNARLRPGHCAPQPQPVGGRGLWDRTRGGSDCRPGPAVAPT